MDVELVEMPVEEAKKRLEEYEDAARRSADEEIQSIRDGYAALAEGTPLVNLGDVIRSAPRDEKHRPMLAVARADRKEVMFSWANRAFASHFVSSADMEVWRLPPSSGLRIDVAMAEPCPGVPNETGSYLYDSQGYALVPHVPPHVLRQRSYLKDHFVLWEVEKWSDSRLRAQPDRDPLLLKPLGGDLYAVVGQWDLTDLERAVMTGRRLT